MTTRNTPRTSSSNTLSPPYCSKWASAKSVITLTSIAELVLERFEVCRVLVIAPLRVARDTWPAEIQKWDHLKGLTYSVAVGTEAERIAALRQEHADPHHQPGKCAVADRAERPAVSVRHGGDRRTVLFQELSGQAVQGADADAAPVARVVGLTGTPSSNGLMDLWAEFRLLDMGRRLGKIYYPLSGSLLPPRPTQRAAGVLLEAKPGAEDEIYRRISDITISMKSADFLQMPEYISNRVPVKLSGAERRKPTRP